MKLPAFLAAVALAAFTALSASAQSDVEFIKAELKKKIPESPTVDTVRKVPYAGLYEVTVGSEVFYTNEKAEFLFAGNIIDLKTKENVTEARMRQVNLIKWDALPLDQAIKVVRGNGSRKIAIFEDPNCGYCKRLERDLQGVSDITVYVLLYPILSPESVTQSKAIWCSADRGKTWLDHMVRDTAINGDSSCANPIDKILALGQAKRVHGTPTIIFENGERVPGAIPILEIEKKFAQVKVASTANRAIATPHHRRSPAQGGAWLPSPPQQAACSPFGSSTHILPDWRILPASAPAASPNPQKKSARTPPAIAPPVSCATMRRSSGSLVLGHVVAR